PVTPQHHATVGDTSNKEDLPPPQKHCWEPEEERDHSGPSNPFAEPLPQTQPSDYLRAACPLCFGGEFLQSPSPSEPDAIVCLDACFTQKRNRQARDPPRTHPQTVFIPEGDAERMDHYVSAIRPPKKPQQAKRTRQEPEDLDPDHYEGGTAAHLCVPKSALDDCEAGFTTADDCREKASTQFFDDPALMALMINAQRAPCGAHCPAKIEAKGLWALDVDDEIWQDIGLDEDITESQPLAWLCDDCVCNGIKALLERDQCLEEEKRLIHECRSMRVWFSEEWKIVNAAINGTDDEAILYHPELRQTSLCRLCALWQKSVNALDSGDIESLPLWGPSTDDILPATVAEVTASVKDDFDEEEFVHNPEDEADLELVDVMDTVALADSYRNYLVDDSDMSYDTLDY
ncbi:hypothetical protein DXG01_003327, partial [Tephrocybe rancida]